MDKVIYKDLSYKITGLLYKTHRVLGRYRNEKQYADYFEGLLKDEGLKYVREFRFEDMQYGRGRVRCVCDFISKNDYYQAKRYLVTLNLKLSIIVNFRQNRLVPKRVLNKEYQV